MSHAVFHWWAFINCPLCHSWQAKTTTRRFPVRSLLMSLAGYWIISGILATTFVVPYVTVAVSKAGPGVFGIA